MINDNKTLARQYCANFGQGSDYGICMGAMMYRHNDILITVLDRDFAGKECIVNKDKCKYFESIVKPGIQ